MALPSVESQKLLQRVAEYYRNSLSADSEGLAYLRDTLQIHHNLVIEDCRIGYSDGSLVDTLPEDPTVISSLTKLGILDKKGRDRLNHCIVVPLTDASGGIVNLYAQNVKNHRPRYMDRSTAGLINHRAVLAYDCAIIVPSVDDLLVMYNHGVRCCAHAFGGSELDSAGAFYRSRSLKRIFIARFKASHPTACLRGLSEFLTKKGIAVNTLPLPAKNALAFFSNHTEKQFQQLIKQTKQKKSQTTSAEAPKAI